MKSKFSAAFRRNLPLSRVWKRPRTVFASALLLFAAGTALACPSKVTLNIQSTGYSGPIDIEFRKGNRPGSKVVRTQRVITRGAVEIPDVCPATYFFAFSTPDADSVSVTRYFEVTDNGQQYSNPVITVTYSRSTGSGDTARVGSARRKDL